MLSFFFSFAAFGVKYFLLKEMRGAAFGLLSFFGRRKTVISS